VDIIIFKIKHINMDHNQKYVRFMNLERGGKENSFAVWLG